MRRFFKPYPNESDSVKEAGEKGKKPVTLTWKFPRKSCPTSHLPVLSSNSQILKAFPKTLATEIKPTINTQQKKKEMRQEKQNKRGRKSNSVLIIYLRSFFGHTKCTKIERKKYTKEQKWWNHRAYNVRLPQFITTHDGYTCKAMTISRNKDWVKTVVSLLNLKLLILLSVLHMRKLQEVRSCI